MWNRRIFSRISYWICMHILSVRVNAWRKKISKTFKTWWKRGELWNYSKSSLYKVKNSVWIKKEKLFRKHMWIACERSHFKRCDGSFIDLHFRNKRINLFLVMHNLHLEQFSSFMYFRITTHFNTYVSSFAAKYRKHHENKKTRTNFDKRAVNFAFIATKVFRLRMCFKNTHFIIISTKRQRIFALP